MTLEDRHETVLEDAQENVRSLDSFLEEAYANASSLSGETPYAYWLVMLSLGIANSSDASEILCLSYMLSDSNFDDTMLLGDDAPWRAGLLAGSVFLGMLLGGLFVGTMGDWFGRKPMLVVGLMANAVAGILSAMSFHIIQLSMLRCVAGLGIGATVPPLFTLVTELAPPSRRGFFVTFCASFWMVGSIYVAVTALVLLGHWGLSWRFFAVACAVPSAVGALMVARLVPESPRFLALQGKQQDATRIANHIAIVQMKYRGRPLEVSELNHQFPLSAAAVTAGNSPRNATQQPWSLSCARVLVRESSQDFLLSTSKLYAPPLRATTYPLQLVWFTLNFGTYGILTWINTIFVEVHLENVYFNALLFAFSNLPGNILAGAFMDTSGRTRMLVGSSLSAAASLLGFAYFAWEAQSNNNNNGKTLHAAAFGIVCSACAFQAFSIAAWNTIDCMTSELFPTSVRSTGMGVCAASGRIGAMVAQFVNGALIKSPVALLLVASFSLVMSAMTPCLLPGEDMSLRPLEDDVVSTMDHARVSHEGLDGASPSWNRKNVEKGGAPYLRIHSRENSSGSFGGLKDADFAATHVV